MRVRRAATGWTMRMEERSFREVDGREKSEFSAASPKRVFASRSKR